MNTQKKNRLKNSIVFRLWAIMMTLIIIAVAFMWVTQIFLFEQNYINAAVTEVDERLNPLGDELKTVDLSEDSDLLYDVMKFVKGKTLVFDKEGNIYASYSNSHYLSQDEVQWFVDVIIEIPEYQNVFAGSQYQQVLSYYEDNYYYEIGIPVKWQGEEAILFLNHPIEGISRVQEINRRQLTTLTVLLALLASIIAWILARQFAKPIHHIKDSVEKLAQGDFTAKPDLKLKDELGELSDSVGELSQALQRVDILRKEVIANVSHELSAPLSVIIGYGEMVRDVSWKDSEERKANLNLIIREARRMSTMVDDIMDYSQFQAGYIQLKKGNHNLYDIINSEIDFSRQVAKDFDIRIVLKNEETDVPVHLDALKISQVMRNLLNNAINHTEDNETIIVIIELMKNTSTKVSVNNPGKPIPPDKKEMIWERYYSSQHRGARRQGTGIGLSIVSTILEAHGFVYGVYYEDGYNCFWFEIK